MTTAQTAKYFFEWGRARDFFRGRGMPHAEADAQRHRLHVKALGRAKSSKDFTNADLDKVIAAFRAVWDGGNLDAQLAQIEMPEKRAAAAVARIGVLMLHLRLENGRETGYVAGIARNLFGCDDGQWHQLTGAQLGRLEGVIARRLRQIHPAEKVAALEAEAAEHAQAVAALAHATGSGRAAGEEEDGNPY